MISLPPLCPPAVIYLIFAFTQIAIDFSIQMYNTAIVKLFVSIIITFLINLLCLQGLTVISWIIVFIPFLFMSSIVAILLYKFGLNMSTGTISTTDDTNSDKKRGDIQIAPNGDIYIYDPEYSSSDNPVYYLRPNIIIPNPHNNDAMVKNPALNGL